MKLIIALPLCCLPWAGQASQFYLSTEVGKTAPRSKDIEVQASADIAKRGGKIRGEFSNYNKQFRHFVYGLNIGYSFDSGFRSELSLKKHPTLLFNTNQLKKQENKRSDNLFSGKIDSYSLLANLYYDVNTGTKFSPYVKIGGGITKSKLSATHSHAFSFVTSSPINKKFCHFSQSATNKNSHFILNAGVGATYSLSRHFSLYSSVTYTKMASIKTAVNTPNVNARIKLTQTDMVTGIRYAF